MTAPVQNLLNAIDDPFLAGLAAMVLFALGVWLLLKGGDLLVDGAVALAKRLGVPALIIGLTLVAFGTSAPELALNIFAAIGGNPDLSFGNVIGSNIANIGLVLGISALVRPLTVHSRVVFSELPLLVVISALTALAPLVPLPWIDTGPEHGYHWPQGLAMVVTLAVITSLWYRSGRSAAADPLTAEAMQAAEGEPSMPVGAALLRFGVGLVLLMLGGNVAADSAIQIAQLAGMSEAVIGLTIVAIATSLPELATCYAACRRGHTDLAVGNVVGSNLFNILIVLGITSLIAPVPVPRFGWWDLGAMLGLTLLLVPMVHSNDHRMTRGQGTTLVVLYTSYLAFSVIRELAW